MWVVVECLLLKKTSSHGQRYYNSNSVRVISHVHHLKNMSKKGKGPARFLNWITQQGSDDLASLVERSWQYDAHASDATNY